MNLTFTEIILTIRKYAVSVTLPPEQVNKLVAAIRAADLVNEFVTSINEAYADIAEFIAHLKTVTSRNELFTHIVGEDSLEELIGWLVDTYGSGEFAYLNSEVGDTFPLGDNQKFWNSI